MTEWVIIDKTICWLLYSLQFTVTVSLCWNAQFFKNPSTCSRIWLFANDVEEVIKTFWLIAPQSYIVHNLFSKFIWWFDVFEVFFAGRRVFASIATQIFPVVTWQIHVHLYSPSSWQGCACSCTEFSNTVCIFPVTNCCAIAACSIRWSQLQRRSANDSLRHHRKSLCWSKNFKAPLSFQAQRWYYSS